MSTKKLQVLNLPQSDWNQNDETAIDYIKNRTHWEKTTTEVVCSGAFEGSYYDIGIDNIQNMPHPGDTCHVVFDGIEYECVAFDKQIEGAHTTCVGNELYINNSPDGTGEPFVFILDVENGLAWINCDSGAHTFSIEVIHEEIHHLDPKYIKDMYYETDSVETVILEEQNIEVKSSGGYIFGDFDDPPHLTANQLYKIIVNGVEYECISSGDEYGSVNLGGFMISSQEGTSSNFPFSIDYYEYNGQIDYCHFYTPVPGTYTISITAIDKEITKILPQYLPQSVGKNVENTQCFIKSEPVVAKVGAEIFNDYTSNIATGLFSHAEGSRTIASGMYSHAEGYYTIASNDSAHAEGNETTASGDCAHAEGNETTASGSYSHAEGMSTISSGHCSHAEGQGTKSSSSSSHAEGLNTIASNFGSHAEGISTIASGWSSHAEGYYTIATSDYQHTQGKHNIEDSTDTYAHIVGNGTDEDARSNAHTLDWDGNAWFAGNIYVGSTSGTNKDGGSKMLITQEYVDVRVPAWTEADEGKFLRIVNGVPTWATVPNAEEVAF